MNPMPYFSVVVAAAIIIIAGAAYTYITNEDEVAMTITLEDDITCTIDGETYSGGTDIRIKTDHKELSFRIDAPIDAPFAYSGKWTSGKSVVTASGTVEGSSYTEFKVSFERGDYEGKFNAKMLDTDDLYPIDLTFSFDESKFKVTSGGSTISNGQVFSFAGDSEVLVESLIGTVDITYNGSWSDDYGGSGSASGDELGTQTIIYITNCAYFGKMTGSMDISYSSS